MNQPVPKSSLLPSTRYCKRVSMTDPDEKSSPWLWPVEWSTDKKFWREVAARTIAAVLSVCILGLPGLVYAISAGVLTKDVGIPIIIGAAILVGVIAVYALAFYVIQRFALKQLISEINRNAPPHLDLTSPSVVLKYARKLMKAGPDERAELLRDYPAATSKAILDTLTHFFYRMLAAAIVAAVAGLISVFAPLFN